MDMKLEEMRHRERCEAIRILLSTIPREDAHREGLWETPDRVARMYNEIFEGYEMDPSVILEKRFHTKDDVREAAAVEELNGVYSNGLVMVKDIAFYSHCEHHMVPFHGKVHIAYIPDKEVVGISKLARLTECFARRLQIQERMTEQIRDAINTHLKPLGCLVVIEAEHLCMVMRGIKKPGTLTVTSAISGVFTTNDALRAETLSLIRR